MDMICRFAATLFLALFAQAGAAPAAEPGEDPLILEKFLGEWRSDGPAFGAPAETVMAWTQTLGGRFYRLDYRIEMRRGDDEASVFEGAAYYRSAAEHAAEGFWADNSGDLLPIRAEADGDALVAHWGVEGEKFGRTRYELTGADKMMVTDWIMGAEGWRRFNQNAFDRINDAR